MSNDYGWGDEPATTGQPQNWGGWGEEPASPQTGSASWGDSTTGGWGEPASSPSQSPSWGDAMSQVGPGGTAWGQQQAKTRKKRRWVRPVIAGGATLSVLALYFGFIVPPVKDIPVENRGATSYGRYMTALASFNTDGLDAVIPDSFVAKEAAYLNGNQARIKAVQALTGTVSYSLPDSPQLTWRNTEHRNPFTWKITQAPSPLNSGESVTLQVPDYSKIKLDVSQVKTALAGANLTDAKDVEYQKKLTDAFAAYIAAQKDIPTKTVQRAPVFTCNGVGVKSKCALSADEDVYMDDTLFAAPELSALQDQFAEQAATVIDSKHEVIQIVPNNGERKYDANRYLEPWVGAHRMETSTDGAVMPHVGDGTFDKPAGLGTPIVTSYIDGDQKQKQPVEVTLSKFVTGTDAHKVMEQKSEQNRGFSPTSDVKYAYYEFTVRNLSDKELTITSRDALVDANRTVSVRTGTVYGLKTSLTLKPGESGQLESWTSSTRLDSLYLIWGSDFPRDMNPVWFKVLAAK